MDMPNRTFGGAGRYGFNGKERDKDMHSLTAYDYGFRIYNSAIGKFLSVDPLTQKFPELTPYQFASNTPIKAVDIDGLETSWRPPGQLGPREDEYKFGSQSTCQGCTVNKELYAPSPPPVPNVIKPGRPPTEAEKLQIEISSKKIHSGENYENYMLDKIRKENVEIVENSPTNIFPIIGSLKRAGKYELMGMHSEAGGALKDAGVEVALGYGIGKAVGVGFKYLNGSTFYRSMSNEAAETFLKTGNMPAGLGETMISPTKSFAQDYSGTLFKIKVSSGTVSQLESIGVRNATAGHPFGNLPLVNKGWKSTNAFFKVEGTQVNIGLGNGNALNIFNSNIKRFKEIK
jgi:RHS repeat-associated protein